MVMTSVSQIKEGQTENRFKIGILRQFCLPKMFTIVIMDFRSAFFFLASYI